MIVCTLCFDRLGKTRIIAIIPQSTCKACGKTCMGYVVEDTK